MALPRDPLLPRQWHIRDNDAAGLDLNIDPVWAPADGPSYSGRGTRTVVIDDGFDTGHRDLDTRFDLDRSYDFERRSRDANGDTDLAHGTAVAGIIAAAANDTGTVGIAYDSVLIGHVIHPYITDRFLRQIAEALEAATSEAEADVVNVSQGISNDPDSQYGAGFARERYLAIDAAIRDAVDEGRGGLGTTIVKAGGNARISQYDINADCWGHETLQVIVAAVERDGRVSDYSSYGAPVLVSGFGTDGQVLTLDRSGPAGRNGSDYTYSFDGTSAAAPMVAGVVALMYEAESGLGWRDVQSILAASARQVGSARNGQPVEQELFGWSWNAGGVWNGGGQHFSNDYGYGLVDALSAVRLAESWLLGGRGAATSANEVRASVDVLDREVLIPDGSAQGETFAGEIGTDMEIERMTVKVDFETNYPGDLAIELTSPGGTTNTLVTTGYSGRAFGGEWLFESQAFRGERAEGVWSVRIMDLLSGDQLRVSDVEIRAFGTAGSDSRYLFTDEYSDHAGRAGHGTVLRDTDGGADIVNAAAVGSASLIRLDGTPSRIDGVNVDIEGIEHAVGGDAGDRLLGSAAPNDLHGMRGNDVLNGKQGDDRLFGNSGDDWLMEYDARGRDAFFGGEGIDTFRFGASLKNRAVTIDLAEGRVAIDGETRDRLDGIENAVGSVSADTLRGDAGANLLRGEGGGDLLRGGDGADTLEGGAGADTLEGGAGADRFVFQGAAELIWGGTDIIVPVARGVSESAAFEGAGEAGGDVIDLSAIDANETLAGDQAFRVDWSKEAGSMLCFAAKGLSRLRAFTDDRKGADFALDIQDAGAFAASFTAQDLLL